MRKKPKTKRGREPKTAAPVKVETVAETTTAEKPVSKRSRKPNAEKTAAETKETAAKRTVKKSEPNVSMKVQLGKREYDMDAIKAIVLEVCNGKVKSVNTVEVYVKPEDNAAYYVVNSEISDKIDL